MDFNTNPYYDDFEATGGPKDSNYVRILFKPGQAVQARELTQIQSILQNQIKSFGDHVFQDGSPVHGGHLSIDTKVKSIKLQQQYNLNDIIPSSFNNQVITNDGIVNNKAAYVLAVDETQQYPTLMIRYLRGTELVDGESIQVPVDTTIKATLVANNSQTTGSVVSINEGIFYVGGYFVYVAPQTIVLDPYGSTPTYRVGLQIDETIIDVSQDSSLLDPAQGSFNYQAPGADRFQFSLVLSKRTLDSIDDSQFFELLRVENGTITKQVDYPLYSDIEKTLARRTYDQSGDYTVVAWQASPQANVSNTAVFDLAIDAGKGYVKGFEFETIATTRIPVDKARTTSSSVDYDLSLEYGNYITVSNVHAGFGSGGGSFVDIGAFETLDMHVVQSAYIDTTSLPAYNSTKIGTTKIRNLVNGGSTAYYAYLLDTNTSPLILNVVGTPTLNTIQFDSNSSFISGAYNNIDISIIAGPGTGDSRRIVSYDGTSNTAIVDRNFSTLPNTSSIISLNFAVKDIDSIVQQPTPPTWNIADPFNPPQKYLMYATQVTNPAAADYTYGKSCMDVDVSGKSIGGNTFIQATNLNKLIYKFPESYIAQGSITNAEFMHKKLIKNVLFTGGNTTISSELGPYESFYYGSDGQPLSSQMTNLNFLVASTSVSSNLSDIGLGQIIDFTDTNASIFRISETEMQLFSGKSETFNADVLVNVRIKNSEISGNRRSKALYGNIANTALVATDSPYNGAALPVNGDPTTFIDKANGYVWFTSNTVIQRVPGVPQSLYVPDVINIIAIYDSGNILYSPNTTNAIDITSNYMFDSGQNDNYYDHAFITLRDTAQPPSGQTVVIMQYFAHDDKQGYFSADSYSLSAYDNNQIPLYSSKTIGSFSLRDAIDFRPTRTIGTDASVTSFNMNGLYIPDQDDPMNLSYAFYLPRIDKLIATQDKEFKLLTGTPSIIPHTPSDSDNGMTLYTIYIPPYTADIRDIKLSYFENRRYTMRDIGSLEKRIEQIEYYTSLSLLEESARNQSVLYQDSALQKEKYGILVDQFDGFNIADNKNPDLICQLSFNELKPYKITTATELNLVSNSGSLYQENDKTFCLAFSETPAIVQNTATKSISVQPYLFGQFDGSVRLTPDSDYWMSTTLVPVVVSPPTDVVSVSTPPLAGTTTIPTTGGINSTLSTNNPIFSIGHGASYVVGGIGIGSGLNYLGYGFINWNKYWSTTNTTASLVQTSVPSAVVQKTITAPAISNSLTLAAGGGARASGGSVKLL